MEKQRFIFDCNGTILMADHHCENEYFRSVLNQRDADHFISHIPSLLSFYESRYDRYDISLLSEYFTKASGVSISPQMIQGWMDAYSSESSFVVDGVVDTLEYLKHRDKSLVILDNWFSEPEKKRLKRSNLDIYFDDIYGGEMAIKPGEKSYKMACGYYSIDSSVMIDGKFVNALGAATIGMDAIYYEKEGINAYQPQEKVKSIGSMRMIKEIC